ncbi:DoxX family protein [Candidatus Acetothermia bacterium]|nr:DoxX family protein [Candidatus Acetothermia bacterium]
MLARIFAPISSLWPLLLRIAVGLVFINHGYGKLFGKAGALGAGIPDVTNFFTNLGIIFPEIFAWVVACIEFFGGFCLILGLFPRYVSLLMTFDMIAAILIAKAKLDIGGLLAVRGYELELLLLAGALALLLGGPGPLSIEKMLFRKEL